MPEPECERVEVVIDPDDDPTKIPEGVEVVSAEDDDSYTADQGAPGPTDETMEQLHGAAWQAAADAQAEGLI